MHCAMHNVLDIPTLKTSEFEHNGNISARFDNLNVPRKVGNEDYIDYLDMNM